MIFGQVPTPENIDFFLPADNIETKRVLAKHKSNDNLKVYIGCAKWNKTDLKNFYPKGIKDELTYYSTQFNSIELNATFYNAPTREQALVWKQKTPHDFKFFPKIPNTISHYKRLEGVKTLTEEFCVNISAMEEKLGMVFLQLHDNFGPKNYDKLERFLIDFPKEVPLAVEVRNKDWFSNEAMLQKWALLLETTQKTNVIVDTAGRRDMLHMRLTSPFAFVRFVGANFQGDYKRLDQWVERIEQWKEQGLRELYFFVHQNVELSSPVFASYFIEKLNKKLGMDIKKPFLPLL